MTSTATADDSAPPVLSGGGRNFVFATVALGMLMAALDQTIVATALPTIVGDLGGGANMAWVVTAYVLASAIATVIVGKFGDMFGRKRVFQLSAIVFITGSAVSGIAPNMEILITGRAIQGIGGGGLMVTAMALIADVIPLSVRGKYQGALGAVFGVTTVLGPLLGGLFTDHASWRWVFYINVPIAILMIAMAARAIPSIRAVDRPIIDYMGIGLVAVGVTCLILGLEWGGQEYPWGSVTIIGLFVLAVVLLAAFVLVELRAQEPMLPMGLFRSRVFTVCSILSFIVGFAMLGVMTFLPTYLQYVNGVSATMSGVRTLPMVVGLLTTSILSGTIVGKTGRYRYFPVAGTAMMALGLYLMSMMHRGTGVWLESLYMLILGLGIGLAMQVLTIVVQNTVPYAELGTATSGVTFFRTIGGAFGTAIFGSVYANTLDSNLREALRSEPGVSPAAAATPDGVRALPPEQAAPIIDAYANAINSVFRWAVPVALVGFVVAWFLREVPLRDTARAGAGDVGEGFAVPDSATPAIQLERAVAGVLRKLSEDDLKDRGIRETAGSKLTRDQAWLLGQVQMLIRLKGEATAAAVARMHWMPAEVLEPALRTTMAAGLIEGDGARLRLTPAGIAEFDRIYVAWRDWLAARLGDWTFTDPEDKAMLDQAIDTVANKMLQENQDRILATK